MRNPFRIRASQRSVNDEEFVKLFGAGALELIETINDPWSGLVFLRSAPGGGKTTFLRLLTPRPLQLTMRLIDHQQVKATHDALHSAGAIGDAGPVILGVMVMFTTEYRDLAEFDRANSLFRALLNSRIVIATMRAVLEHSERSYPDDLATISVEWEPESSSTIPAKATGRELFEWASEIEKDFYVRMDDLGEPDVPSGGHARLDALRWFARSTITDIGGLVDAKRVLLFDDLQALAATQRDSLTEFITNARESCGIWVAERLEALNHRDLLSEGALQERDYEGVIQLERRWAGSRSKTYAKFVEQIANLRAAKAEGFENRDFFSLIAEKDEVVEWGSKFEAACTEIEERLSENQDCEVRYAKWLDDARTHSGTEVERAIRWRTTEILVEQDKQRAQTSFDFDALTTDEFDKRKKRVERAAEHFLRVELQAPVYFGRNALSAVSSSNVDQYLEVAGDLFQEVSAKIRGPRDTPTPLSADRQDSIIRSVAKARWDGLVRRLPQGYAAKQFLSGLGAFCRGQTFRPTAPYAPGVTGFAITMRDRETLIDSPSEDIKHFLRLRDVLTTLVAHNLLIPRVDVPRQGKSVVIFYLNRLLCVEFNLPLGYGGWREKNLKNLLEWLENGAKGESHDEETGLV